MAAVFNGPNASDTSGARALGEAGAPDSDAALAPDGTPVTPLHHLTPALNWRHEEDDLTRTVMVTCRHAHLVPSRLRPRNCYVPNPASHIPSPTPHICTRHGACTYLAVCSPRWLTRLAFACVRTSPSLAYVFQRCFGYGDVYSWQREVMEALLAGKDAIVARPTGGGKSLCFQLPALVDALRPRAAYGGGSPGGACHGGSDAPFKTAVVIVPNVNGPRRGASVPRRLSSVPGRLARALSQCPL